jgi:KUP system potassium uptake protein
MPEWFLIFGIGIATIAAVIASQALNIGFIYIDCRSRKIKLWPKVRINYPSEQKGQLYVPSVNWLLCAGCIGVVLLFRHGKNGGGIWFKYHCSHVDDHHPGIKILAA